MSDSRPRLLDLFCGAVSDPDLTVTAIAQRLGLARSTVQAVADSSRYSEHRLVDDRPVRACLFCGAEVSGRRRHAVFCSVEHRIKHNARKQAERKRAARKAGI